MHIVIIGAGGVGGYFGAKLAQAGNQVTFLARGRHLEAMKKNGLQVRSVSGDFHLPQVQATDNIEEIPQADLIILGVKAWQINALGCQLPQIMHAHTRVLPLQNGILAAEELSQNIPNKLILGGLCRIISQLEAPGVIHHMGITPTIVFGEFNQHQTPDTEKIHELFTLAGIKSKIADDITAELWKKFIAICVSGLLAVTRTTYGELRELPETRQLMIELLEEIFALSKKMGVKIADNFLEKTISFIDTFPHHSTSSLTRDVLSGRPSEIEYQNGAVVKLGKKYGVPTPVNRFVYHCILPMEKKARMA